MASRTKTPITWLTRLAETVRKKPLILARFTEDE